MTTQAKIEANRRNALKSTGPKTSLGKARSSRNAIKHDMTSELDARQVLECFRMILGNPFAEPTLALHNTRAFLALRLAKAEVRLQQLRASEKDMLKEYRQTYDNVMDDRGLIRSLMDGKIFEHPFTRKEAVDILRITGMGMRGGQYKARREFDLLYRYITEAESAHRSALGAWREHETSNPETKPNAAPSNTKMKPSLEASNSRNEANPDTL